MQYFDIHTHQRPLNSENSIYSSSMEDMPITHEIHCCSAGIHPWHLTEENVEKQWQWLISEVRKPGVVAIGECGLDKLKGGPMPIQLQMFERCAELAEERELPLIIHAVKSTEELLHIKKKIKPQVPWIIHGFRGRREVAQQYLKHGFYLSFGEHFQEEALCCVPLDKLLLETDESNKRSN